MLHSYGFLLLSVKYSLTNNKGRLAIVVDFLFVSMFWMAQLGVGSVFHFVCQTSPKLDLITKGGGQAFYIISLIFGIQLAVFFYRKYIRGRAHRK